MEKSSIFTSLTYTVLSERFGTRFPPRARKKRKLQLRKHNRALKAITALKNAARQALRRAKKEGDESNLPLLAGKFLSLLREHSKLKRQADNQQTVSEVKRVREDCSRHFWKFSKDFDRNTASSVSPAFYSTPVWMPPPLTPKQPMSFLKPISIEELVGAIKRSRSTSAPSPLDQIPYMVFKNCPSLIPPLLDLFNTILSERSIPSYWKVAVFKLIGKSAALIDPHPPNNFRPIAMTPAISKLLSGILKDRWLQYMLDNGYLDPIVQKAFLPSVSGVAEHQCKLAAIISGARQDKRSLAVAWLDIVNAYGSVDHSLIQFALNRYHAPPDFSMLIQSWYTDVVGTISMPNGISPLILLKIGVLQVDSLSVVLFLTVMATLSDTLATRRELGVKIPNSQTLVNHLLYADDTCITANSPAAPQHGAAVARVGSFQVTGDAYPCSSRSSCS